MSWWYRFLTIILAAAWLGSGAAWARDKTASPAPKYSLDDPEEAIRENIDQPGDMDAAKAARNKYRQYLTSKDKVIQEQKEQPGEMDSTEAGRNTRLYRHNLTSQEKKAAEAGQTQYRLGLDASPESDSGLSSLDSLKARQGAFKAKNPEAGSNSSPLIAKMKAILAQEQKKSKKKSQEERDKANKSRLKDIYPDKPEAGKQSSQIY